MSENMTQLLERLAAVTAERDHWKANHDNRVRAAKLLIERTDMPMERIGAYQQYVAALEENQKLRGREAKQKPVAMVDAGDDGYFAEILPDCSVSVGDMLYAFPLINVDPVLWQQSFDQWWDAHGQYLRAGGGQYEKTFAYHAWEAAAAFYAAPVAAPAVHKCRGITDANCHYLAVCGDICNKCGREHSPRVKAELVEAGGCAPAVIAAPAVPAPTEFLPDDDTRRNDADFAAQQAATAPSVPDEWRTMMQWLIGQRGKAGHCHARPGVWDDDNGDKAGQPCHQCAMYDRARAMLQSAVVKDSLTAQADCRACVNRGRVNGLSQESYCDSCTYQGRDWRQNHFVDARKMVDTVSRRCEACAILPCSCK